MRSVAPSSALRRLKGLLAGAAYVIVAQTLYRIAYLWRRVLVRTTFVAVTGTHGKTTIKELLATVLGASRPTFRSRANENSGLALTLNMLRVRPWHRFAVIELGVGAPGEMRRLARLVSPDAALVLSLLRTHIKAFGDRTRHSAEKAILLEELRPAGVAILNGDDPLVAGMAAMAHCTVVMAGTSPGFDVWADGISSCWPGRLELDVHIHGGESYHLRTRLVGAHWASAVAVAVAAARALGVPLRETAVAVAATEPVLSRMQPMLLPSGAVLLRDDYDGSIDTFEAGLRVLADARAERRVVVISDASDYGNTMRRKRLAHLGREVARVAEVAVFVGEAAEHGGRGALAAGMAAENVHVIADLREAAGLLQGMLRRGDLVLLKGRISDHISRLHFAQLGPIGCWKARCEKVIACDVCPELRIAASDAARAAVVPPEWAAPAALDPPQRR